MLNTPMPMASTIAAGKPPTSPSSIHFFIHSGMKSIVSRSNPKNVCINMPMKNVPAPSVITSGASLASPATFFLITAPNAISTSPYPASPRQSAKNSIKNGASTGVGSNSLYSGIPYIPVRTSNILANLLFLSFIGGLSSSVASSDR